MLLVLEAKLRYIFGVVPIEPCIRVLFDLIVLLHLVAEGLFAPPHPNLILPFYFPDGLFLLDQKLHVVEYAGIDLEFGNDPFLNLLLLPPANFLELFLRKPFLDLILDLSKFFIPLVDELIADSDQVILSLVQILNGSGELVASQIGVDVEELEQGFVKRVPVVVVDLHVSVQLQQEHRVHHVPGLASCGQTNQQPAHLPEVVDDIPAPAPQRELLLADDPLLDHIQDIEAEAQISVQAFTGLLLSLVDELADVPTVGQGILRPPGIKLRGLGDARQLLGG